MAKWLDKYEQGGMVLKQKTHDNYGKKPNPNDVQASVGPDFVGLGYNTKGRDYSPSWGGQFQNGGVMNKASMFASLPTKQDIINYGKINYPELMKKGEEIGKRIKLMNEFNSLNPSLPMHSDTLYPGNKYKDAFMKTPNIRTEKDASFKKGHSLTNEQKAIVLHHTGYTDTARDNDVSWAMRGVDSKFRNSEESSHVVIDFNGNRYNYANPNQVTSHAGNSMMNGRDNVNDFGVGVEFQGDTDQSPLTKEQIESFMEYAVPIMKKNKIPIDNIVTHKQIRKNYIDKNPNDKKAAAESKPDVNDKEYSKIIQALKKKGVLQMGGSIPGAVGFTYARTQNPAPDNGKYAKKTKASAQNGTDIKLGNTPISSFVENLLIDKNDKTEIQKQQDFVDNWYKNRKIFKDDGAVDTIKYPKISSDTKPIYTVKTDLGAYGKYDPTANEIKLNRLEDFAELGVPTHEYNHFYQSNPNIGFFPKKNKNRKIGDKYVLDPWEKGLRNNIDNITPEDMKYYLSPDEVQSRLMEIRYLNNLKPDQKVKPSDINNLKIPKESEYLKEKLKSKDHGLDWFLNNIVKNNQQQESTQAQNGTEMAFYQNGLDFKPKTISKNGSVIKDDMGQWAHPGEVTEISGNTMATHGYGDVPLYVVPDKGSPRIVQANTGTQKFPGATKFTEFPMAQDGGWLDKYSPEPMRQDATRNVVPRKMTDKERLEAVATSDQAQKKALNTAKEVITERQKNKATKGDLNTPGSWNIKEKARLSNILPASWAPPGGAVDVFDEYINPATYVGVLTDALGESIAARDPKGIATSLGLSAIGGGLGLDPLGAGIKAVKSIGKGIVKPSFNSGKEAYDFINNMVNNGQEEQMLNILTKKTGKTSRQLENEFGRAIGNDGTIRDPEYIIRHANMLSGKNNLPKFPKSLKELDEKAGELVSPSSSSKFDNNKIVARANEILKKGVGIKNKDIPIELKSRTDNELELWVNDNNPQYVTGQSKSGTIDLSPNFRGANKSLTFTDWLKGKKPTTKYDTYDPDAIPGVIKAGDFPYQSRLDLEGTGIGAETAEALKQALNEEGLQLFSSKSHTEAGKLRYLTEFLNNRKQVVDYSDNPDWMNRASTLRDLLGGAPISKKEAKAYISQYPELKPAHVRFQYDNGGWLNKYK